MVYSVKGFILHQHIYVAQPDANAMPAGGIGTSSTLRYRPTDLDVARFKINSFLH